MAGAGLGIAGAIATTSRADARPLGANGRLTVAVIGRGQMGTSHVRTLARREDLDLDLAYACDVDEGRADGLPYVLYEQLPVEQQKKDALFKAIVSTLQI